MTAATLVTLALGLALGQAEPSTPSHDAVKEMPAVEQHGERAVGEALEQELGAGHGGAHEGGGLSEQMMHHVTDGHVLEYPGHCDGHWAWNCEVELDAVFGTIRGEDGTVSGPLVFTVGGHTVDMTPTKHLVMMWLASLLLVVMLARAVRKRGVVPSGLYNFFEVLVAFVRNEIAVKNIGERDADRFVPYLVTAFFFILFVNLFGLIPYAATATGNLAVTVTLAIFTFVATQWAAIRSMGIGGWLHHLTGGVHWLLWPIMVPVEILGLFTKPFALTVRLFANMIAGHIVILSLIGLIFALNTSWVAIGSVPMALAIFLLEIFVAFVQAYIFTMLSALFIGSGLVHHDEHEAHGAHEGHAGPAMGSMETPSHAAGNVPGHG